jgi:hypothetical protein
MGELAHLPIKNCLHIDRVKLPVLVTLPALIPLPPSIAQNYVCEIMDG